MGALVMVRAIHTWPDERRGGQPACMPICSRIRAVMGVDIYLVGDAVGFGLRYSKIQQEKCLKMLQNPQRQVHAVLGFIIFHARISLQKYFASFPIQQLTRSRQFQLKTDN